MSAGLSNAAIAERLVIAPGTVANHVQHILVKLGMRTRVQIALWAVERGLIEAARAGGTRGEPQRRALIPR